MNYLWPGQAQWETFTRRFGDTAPLTMLNLLRYREHADYTGYPDEVPCSGRDAYRRYAARVIPCLQTHGARLVFAGAAGAALIGPDSEYWDDVLLVEYPSLPVFRDMLESEGYREFAYHRTAALQDSRLIPVGASEWV